MKNGLVGKAVKVRKSVNRFSGVAGYVDDCYTNEYGREVYLLVFKSHPNKRFAFDRAEFTVLDTAKIEREHIRIANEIKAWDENHPIKGLIPVEGYNS